MDHYHERVNDSKVSYTVTAYEDQLPMAAIYFASGSFDSECTAREAPAKDYWNQVSTSSIFETTGTYDYFCIPHEDVGTTSRTSTA